LYNSPYKSLNDNNKTILPPSTVLSNKDEGTRPFMEGKNIESRHVHAEGVCMRNTSMHHHQFNPSLDVVL